MQGPLDGVMGGIPSPQELFEVLNEQLDTVQSLADELRSQGTALCQSEQARYSTTTPCAHSQSMKSLQRHWSLRTACMHVCNLPMLPARDALLRKSLKDACFKGPASNKACPLSNTTADKQLH